MAATKNTTRTNTGKATPTTTPEKAAEKLPTGGYEFAYNAKTKEFKITGTCKDAIRHTAAGKPIYAVNEGKYVQVETSDGRKLRYAVIVYEEPTAKPVEAAAPSGVSASEWAEFQAFQAWKAAQGK
jgi:hypothetical protein